jgi:hypothetical protein
MGSGSPTAKLSRPCASRPAKPRNAKLIQ